MEVFAKVASLGSFSAAARALNLSQTMVTKHVASLEADLGVQLLNRTTHRVTATDAGARYADSCRRILDEIAEANASVAAERIEPAGTLRLSCPVSFGTRELAPLLPSYARAYPKVTVDLGLNDRTVDLLEEGWDMAIRIGSLRDSSLKARKLAPCRMVVCAAPSYLAEHGTPKRIADLSRHNCLGYTLSPTVSADRWAFGRGGEDVIEVAGMLRANNGDALLAAAVEGLGIVYEPSFIVAPDIRAGRLAELDLDRPTVELSNVYALYPATREPPAKIRTMIDHVAAAWSPIPPWDR